MIILGGWFEHGHRWKDYINRFENKTKPYLEAIRREVIGGGCVEFAKEEFTDRAWADLMAAIWAEEEDRDYGYVDFWG